MIIMIHQMNRKMEKRHPLRIIQNKINYSLIMSGECIETSSGKG